MMVGAIFFITLITSPLSEDPWTGGSVLNEPVANKAGVFGAYLSDISFAIFGYVSYIVPIAIVWLGYNFHRDANKERQSQLTFLMRLISFFVMLFFIAALAHQYAPNIALMDNIKVAFLSGGWVGESMHEHLFYGVFGRLQHLFMSESFWLVLVLQLAPLGKILLPHCSKIVSIKEKRLKTSQRKKK